MSATSLPISSASLSQSNVFSRPNEDDCSSHSRHPFPARAGSNLLRSQPLRCRDRRWRCIGSRMDSASQTSLDSIDEGFGVSEAVNVSEMDSDLAPHDGGLVITAEDADGRRSYRHECRAHPQVTVHQMYDLFKHQVVCDVTLCVGHDEIACHRVVLASCSEYFRRAFCFSRQEEARQRISLPAVTLHSLKAIVKFAYTGRVVITLENVADILQAAAYLLVQGVRLACETFLCKRMTVSNCASLLHLSEQYGCLALQRSAIEFCATNFTHMTANGFIHELPQKALKCVLQSDLLNVPREADVYRAIMQWTRWGDNVDPSLPLDQRFPRIAHLPSLLSQLRWWLLPPQFVTDAADQLLIKSDAECVAMVNSSREHLMHSPCKCTVESNTSHHEKGVGRLRSSYIRDIFAIGGRGGETTEPLRSVERYNYYTNTWTAVCSMEEARRHVAACTAGGLIYVAGGHDGTNHLRSVGVLNPSADPPATSWRPLGPMKVARRGLSLVACDQGRLYAIGGIVGDSATSIVERYNIKLNKWSLVASMPSRRGGCGAVFFDGKIYVAGGTTAGTPSMRTMEKYDCDTNTWSRCASMNYERASFGMTTAEGMIIVAGGFDNSEPLSSAEIYCPRGDSWTLISPMTIPRGGVSLTTASGLIFAVGGYNHSSKYLCSVEVLGDLPEQQDPSLTRSTAHSALDDPELYARPSDAGAAGLVPGSSSPYMTSSWCTLSPMAAMRAGCGTVAMPCIHAGYSLE